MAKIEFGNVDIYVRQLIAEELGFNTDKKNRLQNKKLIRDTRGQTHDPLHREASMDEAEKNE